MSLINDALKKAQKQRTEENPALNPMPSIGGEPAARIAKRAKPLGFNSLLMWIGLGAGGVLVLLVGSFFLIRWMMARPEAPLAAKPAIVAKATPATVEPTPTGATTTPASAPYVLPVAPPPTPVAARAVPVEAKPVVPPPEPEAPKPVVPALKLLPKAIAYIEALHVAGIRASTTDSKVLMNDRVYRVGDTVEHQLGLKLAEITSSSLTFEDERGARYTRNF
jgi:hypothetical protein